MNRSNDRYKDFPDRFKNFIFSHEHERLVNAARRILILDNENGQRSFRLLPAQGAQLAQRTRRVFFIFLSWVDSRLDQQAPWLGLDEEAHRRLIGVITAISWFKQYEEDCIALLWPHRTRLHEPGILRKIIRVQGGRLPLLPLPPPEILQSVIRKRVTDHDGIETFNLDLKDDTNVWNSWKFWRDFAKPHSDDETTEAYRWYENPANLQLGEGDQNALTWRSQAWANFVGNLRLNRNLVLYAQREALHRWFVSFDPTSTDRLEDTDRPWDFDHIHANYFTSGIFYIPQIIKDWHGSIGNLRAWPAELNKSDSAVPPRDKLCHLEEREKTAYEMKGEFDILAASAITEAELQLWLDSCPKGTSQQYLAGEDEHNLPYVSSRIALLKAITGRWVRLYETWYRELRIADLVGGATDQP